MNGMKICPGSGGGVQTLKQTHGGSGMEGDGAGRLERMAFGAGDWSWAWSGIEVLEEVRTSTAMLEQGRGSAEIQGDGSKMLEKTALGPDGLSWG